MVSNMQVLLSDGQRIIYRGLRRRGSGDVSVLIARPTADYPLRGSLDRFYHEFGLKSELNSAWAIRPLDLVHEAGKTALMLEDPGGEPLERLLGAPMELGGFLLHAVGIAAALGEFHAAGLVHKDIKPAHLFVNCSDGQVRLTGFGIASRLPRERQAPDQPETIAGTLAYMAPEQTGRMNRSVDSRSDLYSLGVTLYRMLTGVLPFAATDPMEWVHCHIAKKPVTPAERLNTIPASVSRIVMKLLAKTAEDRYQTAASVERDLRRCVSGWERQNCIDDFMPGEYDTPDRLVIPEKLYGREDEVANLLACFGRIVKGGLAELVLVKGYSGIGKSSVVNELHRVLVPRRGLFASGKFDQYKRGIPYSTLVQAFQSLVRPLLGKSDPELAGWRDALVVALEPNARLMTDLIPELKLIIGDQPPVPELEPQRAQGRFQMVFRRFIGVFARPEHPLALFLDDLQWLDAATLDLLENLLTRPELRHLLLIGAYRDNEVCSTHPLMGTLRAIKNAGVRTEEMTLSPLACGHVEMLIVDAFHRSPNRAQSLAQLLHEKTAGNPFFVNQFFCTLVDEGLVRFDYETACWAWHLRRIEGKDYTDNVADLMVGKLTRLPPETQTALQRLACLGNSAEITTLAVVLQLSPEEVHVALWPAIRQELVEGLDGCCRFVHDRVQEAAYSLIQGKSRSEAHLRIGRLLAAQANIEKREETIFEIVNQLNKSATLIDSPEERKYLAELNLVAGRRAKGSAAYVSASAYLAAGMAMLGHEDWTTRYELMFGLWLERAECEYMSGNFDEADRLILQLVARGASKIDKAAAYRIKIDIHVARSQNPEAVESAVECLRLFGIEMQPHPTWEQVDAEYQKVWRGLAGRTIESLINLPLMNDREMQAAMRVLSVLYAPAYFTDINLVYLHLCHMLNVSLKYGVTGASAHAYAWFGAIIGPVFHRYADDHRFGRLACNIVEKHDFVAFKAKVYFSMEMAALWTQPLDAAIDFITAAFRTGVETGDLAIACYSCTHILTDLLARGNHLDEVWRESERRMDFARKGMHRDVVDIIVTQQRFIQNMRGKTDNFATFNDPTFKEDVFEAQLVGGRAASMVCWYWILKVQARFMSKDYEAAIAAASEAEALLWSSSAHIQLLDYYYYVALTIAAAFVTAPTDRQRTWRGVLMAHLDQLRDWAENCSQTFHDKHALVAAEVARLEGRELDAERLYERAICSARDNGFVHNEALCHECASAFYRGRGFDAIADLYLRNAHHGYMRWGADGKVRQLEDFYPFLRAEEIVPSSASTIATTVEHLELSTVMNVSKAVSGEIVLEKLIHALLNTAVEHAGAERGLLILPSGAELRVVAQALTDGDTVHVKLCDEPAGAAALPGHILRHVLRTGEDVILDDAAANSPFSDDPYIRRQNARSILCLPLINQAKLAGALYLENNSTNRVFAPGRIAVLRLVASQAAIALENACLYRDLAGREARIRRLVDANIIGIFIWNVNGDIIEANESFLHMLGYDRNDLVAGRMSWTGLTPMEWHETDEIAVRDIGTTGGAQPYEKEYIRKNGSRVAVMVGATLFEAGANEGVAFVLDLTERKRAEEDARQSERRYREVQAELAHTNRVLTMGQLAASIAHEVKQPIAATANNARAALRWLRAQPPDLEEVQQALQCIVSDVTRAADVIDRIRDLIRKVPPRKERVDINAAIREVIELTRSEAIKHGAAVQTELADGLPFIEGDRVELQQVLLNLVINAFEAMNDADDGMRLVQISTVRSEDIGVLVAVRDSGPGFAPDGSEQVFSPFYTTKATGLGMGLSISRSIVEAQGGRLWASANMPHGAIFQFSLRTDSEL